jgi:hypothetical protein
VPSNASALQCFIYLHGLCVPFLPLDPMVAFLCSGRCPSSSSLLGSCGVKPHSNFMSLLTIASSRSSPARGTCLVVMPLYISSLTNDIDRLSEMGSNKVVEQNFSIAPVTQSRETLCPVVLHPTVKDLTGPIRKMPSQARDISRRRVSR